MRRALTTLTAVIALATGHAAGALALSCTDPLVGWGNEALARKTVEQSPLIFVGRALQGGHAPCSGAFVFYRVHIDEVLKGRLVPPAAADGTIVIAHQVWPACPRSGTQDLGPIVTGRLLYLAGSPREGRWASISAIDKAKASAVLGLCSLGHDLDGPIAAEGRVIRERLIGELRLQRNRTGP